MVTEDAIRERSYQIWLQSGCPEGRAIDHWLEAKSELEAERFAKIFGSKELRYFVMAKPPISRPPQRVMSSRIRSRQRPAA